MKPHPFSLRLGKIIRQKRVSQGLPQGEVAYAARLNKGQISAIENGRNQTVLTLRKLCSGLGVSMADVIEEVEQSFRVTHPRP